MGVAGVSEVGTSVKVPQGLVVSAKGRGLGGVLRRETNIKCLILTCLIFAAISALVWCRMTTVTKLTIDYDAFPITSERSTAACEELTFLLPASFVLMLYGLYLVECWYSNAWTLIRQPKSGVAEAYALIARLRSALPRVWWKANSYHYVRRTREIARTNQGHKVPYTQLYYERVSSALAQSCFFYSSMGVGDTSPRVVGLENYVATRIRLKSAFIFANRCATEEYEEQRTSFFQDQGRLDDYLEMREGFELLGQNKKWMDHELVAWGCPKTWMGSPFIFWVANFLLLSWPFRLFLHLNTGHCQIQVTKLFGTNYIMRTRHALQQQQNQHPNHDHQSQEDDAAGRQSPLLLLGRGDFLLEKYHHHNIIRPRMLLERSVTFLNVKAASPDGLSRQAPSYSQALLWSGGDEPPTYEEALAIASVNSRLGLLRPWNIRRCFTVDHGLSTKATTTTHLGTPL